MIKEINKMSEKLTKGIFYVATGDKFIEEACRSAESIKEYMPDVHITAYIDKDIEASVFDDVRLLDSSAHSFADKISPFIDPPYDHNIFIDTDTLCLDDFSELFEILDTHDMGICHCSIKEVPSGLDIAPEWFPEVNTGMVVFKKGASQQLFIDWEKKHKEFCEIKGARFQNQPAFRYCLFRSAIKWVVIPREYNLRVVHGWFAAGNMKVKIVHGRGLPMRKALRNVNKVKFKYRGNNLKPRVGTINIVERICWKLLRMLKLDVK